MTAAQERKLNDTHDAVIRIESSLGPKVDNMEHTLYGNGKPGIKEEVALLKQSHNSCRKSRDAKPAMLISVCAVLVAVASPIIQWLLAKGA